ncbi:paraquat-inducible protein A [Aestuariispira insulae]|uniref:Paraquat-inducible protein A n=1 Tax=Aestuariispira insulae TaxID=1461337 RepID=A0A3D9HF41_9PROT|nr:paraquat-inducible protein A [Aestuariispira insulae]RED48100.1 paraquat-inducible protein A [Aestuariispira insulae]
MSTQKTAAELGAIGCHDCGLLVSEQFLESRQSHHCPRCRAPMHRRKPLSLAKSWAYLLAAAILYIPANMMPIMTVISFGSGAPDTIMSGVIHLAAAGQYPIALLVFIASVFVPLLKIGVLAYLLVSVQWNLAAKRRQRTRMYRMTELIGRWSMIDIFMISILVALVKLDAIATIEAGPGAIAFAAVVVLTMIAAQKFDPRLIWDVKEKTVK